MYLQRWGTTWLKLRQQEGSPVLSYARRVTEKGHSPPSQYHRLGKCVFPEIRGILFAISRENSFTSFLGEKKARISFFFFSQGKNVEEKGEAGRVER